MFKIKKPLQTICFIFIAVCGSLSLLSGLFSGAVLADHGGCTNGTVYQNNQCVSPSSTSGGSTSTTTTKDYCHRNFKGGQISACEACQPNGDTPTCICRPEYQPGGNALTTTQYESCQACNVKGATAATCLPKNPIVKEVINPIVNVLAGLVGVVCVAMIVVGGIQYSMARNNPQATAAARGKILNAVVAMIAFMFIWAFLQYLIPGGVFK